MLSLVRSTKNTFASINRIPPEVLSLIAHLRDKEDTDENLIALTHVCRSWREIFISHASLWTNLDCTVFDKTRVYLKRSKTSPLDIYLDEEDFLNDAFLLTVPHLNRLGSLFLSGPPDALPRLIKYLGSPSPLLRKLSLSVDGSEEVVLQDTFFGGDLSSLRELRLDGVITNLAWENMSNLGTFVLLNVSADKISVTQLLNFFERAPLLHSIRLQAALPSSSNAPPGRVVPLPNLKYLIIIALRLHTTLLNHLLIPTGAMITQAFPFTDTKSPILFQLPKDLRNLQNISNVTSISIRFDSGPLLLFEGPSGGHKIICIWKGQGRISTNIGPQVIRSLDAFGVSAVEKLTITHWQFTSPSVAVDKSPIYRILHLMNSLRTLTLTACLNRPFVLALNPKKNPLEWSYAPSLSSSLYMPKGRSCSVLVNCWRWQRSGLSAVRNWRLSQL